MSEVPARLAVLLSELTDAIVPSIVGVSILVHICDGWQVPHADAALTASCEDDPLVLRMSTSHSEERACVAPESHVGLSINFQTLKAPEFDGAIL